MPNVSSNQVNGILRALVPAGIAWAVAKGWVPSAVAASLGDNIMTAVAAIIAVVSAGWSFQTNKS